MRDTPFSLRFYRWLLKLYPGEFRESYAGPMEREFRDELAESTGVWTALAFWIRLLVDLSVSIPVQVSREVVQDFRYTLRLWVRRPWHAGFTITALAIGIGASTGVFSVLNALLLRSLPFHEPNRLAQLHQFIPPHDSVKEFHDWRQHSSYLVDAALFEENDANLGGARTASRAHIAQTSWNFFSVLGTQPTLGRGFAENDDVDGTGWGAPGRNAVAVISYGLWQQLLGGDEKALGTIVRVDGNPLTIIGVAPPGFDYPGKAVLWKPAAFSPGNNGWGMIARLKPGITWPQARAAFAVEAERLSPNPASDSFSPRPAMTSLQDGLAGPMKNASVMFMCAVLLVMLIACTNVAHLLMARTADRAGELSIRSALGASRARLVRQLLTECLLLSFVATLVGLLMAFWIASLAAKIQPPPLGSQSYSILDANVLTFALVVSLIAPLLFGILPLLYVRRIQAFPTHSSNGTRGSRLVRESLACTQVLLTMILLAGSVSLGRAFFRLMSIDRGYEVKGVVTVCVSLDGTTHQLEHRQLSYFDQVLDRVRSLPGVHAASATEFLPLHASAFVGGPFGLDGRPAKHNSTMVPVLSGYFRTMGGRLLYGREFTDAEIRSGAKVAVVNERFSEGFGAPADAVGHQLTIDGESPSRIIGVVRGMEYETDPTLADSNQVFVPSVAPGSFFSTFVARVDGRAEDHLVEVRDAIQSVDPQVPVFSVKTMEQRLDEVFAAPRFYRTAAWIFAGFALLLAVIGIYGIVSYAVVQRTQEIGVRMALGRTPVQLRGMLLRQGLLMVLAGAVPGILAARLTGRFLESLISGARSIDMVTSAGLVLFLAVVASTSIWSATRRISRLDIVAILRCN
jgi:predicted permease